MINTLIFRKSKSLTLSYLMAQHAQHRDQTTDKASTATLTTLQQKGSNRNTCKEIKKLGEGEVATMKLNN